MHKINKISLTCLGSLLLVLGSCTGDGECRQTVGVSLGAELYHTEFDIVSEQFVTKTYSDTLTVFGLDNDSLLAYNENKSSIRLFLKPFADTTTYIFERKHLVPDTINFIYANENNFISLECGCWIFHRIKEIENTYYNIDSVIVINDFVANDKEKNIKIYLKSR